MGDITDMILDGILCEHCGCLLPDMEEGKNLGAPKEGVWSLDNLPGFPRSCPDCSEE